jgi:hypothetical protein
MILTNGVEENLWAGELWRRAKSLCLKNKPEKLCLQFNNKIYIAILES